MNGLAKEYVKAVSDLVLKGEDVNRIIKGLKAAMKKRGHLKLLPVVLNGLSRELPASMASGDATLTVAKAEDVKQFAKLKRDARVVVDPTIVGGYILEKDHLRADHSYKHQLIAWYRRAINDRS